MALIKKQSDSQLEDIIIRMVNGGTKTNKVKPSHNETKEVYGKSDGGWKEQNPSRR